MDLNSESCYQALVAHDSRFDGVFFVAVSTTGIYCRTVCTARTPRRDRCAFYPSAAAAERAGFRPCRRCRPECAPGRARIDAIGRLAAAAADRIEDGALSSISVAELAGELRVSDRHLRRVIEREFGVTPVELAQTHRLLLAKRLLTDTGLPITEVALASGFSSLRRFNALFKERYRICPSDIRRRARVIPGGTLPCELAYRPPFDWDALLEYLAARAVPGVESIQGTNYLRTVALVKHRGWLAVYPVPKKHALRVELSGSLAGAIPAALARVKRLFDLAAEPQRITTHLGSLAASPPGLRVPGAFNGFETAVSVLLEAEDNATNLAGRIASAFGEPLETPHSALTHLFPKSSCLAAVSTGLDALGIPSGPRRAIVALAQAVVDRSLRLEAGGDADMSVSLLMALPGISSAIAQIIAMRSLSWPDAFPHTDTSIGRALNEANPHKVLNVAESWRPWRAYAAMYLWKSLEEKS